MDQEKEFDKVHAKRTSICCYEVDGEAEVRMVKETYWGLTAVVRVETSEQLGVGVSLRQGSVLRLLTVVMNLISRKEQEELKKILYSDDLAVVADSKGPGGGGRRFVHQFCHYGQHHTFIDHSVCWYCN